MYADLKSKSVLSVNMALTNLGLVCMGLQVFNQVVYRVEGSPAS